MYIPATLNIQKVLNVIPLKWYYQGDGKTHFHPSLFQTALNPLSLSDTEGTDLSLDIPQPKFFTPDESRFFSTCWIYLCTERRERQYWMVLTAQDIFSTNGAQTAGHPHANK